MRAANDTLTPGTLVEIRNPFMNDKGVRYDQRVRRGVIVETHPGRFNWTHIHDYLIMVEDELKLYTTSMWDITPVSE